MLSADEHPAQSVAPPDMAALDDNLRGPPLEWKLLSHDIGPDTWTVRCQQYDDPRG